MLRQLLRLAGGLSVLFLAITILSTNSNSDIVAQKRKQPRDQDKQKEEKQPPPPDASLPESWVKAFQWRSIGPANMGGRITAISVFEADPSTYWIATASGGLVKTSNNGVTFEHQFDHEATVSVGDVCVAPSDKNIVWVGTGENNPRNSVSYGDGIYKSTDGGKSWKNMGLRHSFQIGRIVVHPTNPDVVYVGALGRLYGPNEDRGLYKTIDGGRSWEKILYIDDKTGVIDLAMHPADPQTLFIATWERQRDGYDSWPGGKEAGVPDGYDLYDPVKKWGAGSGIFKTTDGGRSFRKLGNGLPTNLMGRIGLNIYRKDPNVVFAIVDCEKIGMGTPPKAGAANNVYTGFQGADVGGDKGASLTRVAPEGPGEKAGLKVGDVITKMDGKDIKTFEALTTAAGQHKVGDKVKLEVLRDNAKMEVELTLAERPFGKKDEPGGPGGPSATRPYHANYGGQAANAQEKQGPNSFEYGGVYKSTDGGESWKRLNSINPRPMYFSLVRVDPCDDKQLWVGGVQLFHSTDGGKDFRQAPRGIHADHHALWIDPKDGRHMIIGTDGGFYITYDRGANWDHMNQMAMGQFYHVAVCSKKPYFIYGGLQDNGTWGIPSMTLRGSGPINEEAIPIFGGDGYVCRVDQNDPDQIYYEMQNGGMGRYNLRTAERTPIRPRGQGQGQGQGTPRYRFNWNTPFILSNHNSNIFYCGANYVFRSVKKGDELQIISPEITRTKNGSATAVAESPRNPEVLWAGTDDGNLWVTRNGGKDWKNIAEKLGLGRPIWISTVECSRFVEGRAYVVLDAHRSDDDEPYIFMTEDFGDTWKSLRANLPSGSSRCLREDVSNPNLLFLGTEFAIYASINRGASWTKLNNNLPTVAVHEIAIHPTAGEIVAATHGRSLWILDVTALRGMATDSIKTRPTLYKPNTVIRWQQMPGRGQTGRRFVGENPPREARIIYSLPDKAKKTTLQFFDIDNNKLNEMTGPADAGLHRVSWNLFSQNRPVPAGAYRVVLKVDDVEHSQSFRVEGDPAPGRSISAEEEDEEGEGEDR
jgi:photosystem II stability/assembly factor-like uncharacterized protein